MNYYYYLHYKFVLYWLFRHKTFKWKIGIIEQADFNMKFTQEQEFNMSL